MPSGTSIPNCGRAEGHAIRRHADRRRPPSSRGCARVAARLGATKGAAAGHRTGGRSSTASQATTSAVVPSRERRNNASDAASPSAHEPSISSMPLPLSILVDVVPCVCSLWGRGLPYGRPRAPRVTRSSRAALLPCIGQQLPSTWQAAMALARARRGQAPLAAVARCLRLVGKANDPNSDGEDSDGKDGDGEDSDGERMPPPLRTKMSPQTRRLRSRTSPLQPSRTSGARSAPRLPPSWRHRPAMAPCSPTPSGSCRTKARSSPRPASSTSTRRLSRRSSSRLWSIG